MTDPPSHTSLQILEDHILKVLNAFIKNEKPDLNRFYPEGSKKLKDAAAKGADMVLELEKLGCSWEMAVRFSTLALYDLVVLLGQSSILFCYVLLTIMQTTVIRW
jgi:hypothetical protein